MGLQGIVDYFGGVLDRLDYPVHAKSSLIKVKQKTDLFRGLGERFTAKRYHSPYAQMEQLPAELRLTAVSEEGIVMAVEHQSLLLYAVEFHPETILSLPLLAGMKIISNLMDMVSQDA